MNRRWRLSRGSNSGLFSFKIVVIPQACWVGQRKQLPHPAAAGKVSFALLRRYVEDNPELKAMVRPRMPVFTCQVSLHWGGTLMLGTRAMDRAGRL